jgi:hypothetical protein
MKYRVVTAVAVALLFAASLWLNRLPLSDSFGAASMYAETTAVACEAAISVLDASSFRLAKISTPRASIELRLARALQPLLCAAGWLKDRQAVVVDIGVNSGIDLPAWFHLFGTPSSIHGIPQSSAQRIVAAAAACPTSLLDQFLFFEPQQDYRRDIVIAIEEETNRRRDLHLVPLSKVQLITAVVGAKRHAGGVVFLVGEGEIAMAALDESEELRRGRSAARVKRRRRRAEGRHDAPEAWVEQRDHTAPVVRLVEVLRTNFSADASTVPFLKIDTEGADSVIVQDSEALFRDGRVGVLIFEVSKLHIHFSEARPSTAIRMLQRHGYRVFVAGVLHGSLDGDMVLASIDDAATFTTLWHVQEDAHVVVALHKSVHDELRRTTGVTVWSKQQQQKRSSFSTEQLRLPVDLLPWQCFDELVIISTRMTSASNAAQRHTAKPQSVGTSAAPKDEVGELLDGH